MLRYGDYIILVNLTLNLGAAVLYAYQLHWWNALYWTAAFLLNLCLLNLK